MSNRREKNKPQNTLNRQLDYEVKAKEKNESQIQFGKFLYSLAGLTYAGVVLAKLTDFDKKDVDVLSYGALAMAIFVTSAWVLIKRGNVKKIRS